MHHTVVSVSAGVITISSPDLQVQEFAARKIHDLDYQEISDRASGMMVERILTHELHRVIGYWSRALGAQQDNPYDPFWEYLARSVCRAGGPMLREALPSVYAEAEFHGPEIKKPKESR